MTNIHEQKPSNKEKHDKKVGAAAASVGDQHRHTIPLDVRDIIGDLDTPLEDASLAAKSSVIVRAGALDLSAGTGSFRVRELMGRMGQAMNVYVRADVELTDIEAECSDGTERMSSVVDLPTTGVNTERIWYMEHFADWLSVNMGQKGRYHTADEADKVSAHMVDSLPEAQRHRTPLSPAITTGESVDDNGIPTHRIDDTAQLVLPPAMIRELENGETTNKKNVTASQKTGNKKGITVRQAHERLDAIEYKKPLYQPWFMALAAAVACACFVFLLGGGIYDMLAAFIGAGCGQFLRAKMLRRHINQFFTVMVSVALAAFIAAGFLAALSLLDPTALSHDTAYIGAILFVIPGFPLITGGLDIFKMDIQSGIQRLTYFMSIVLVATLSAWAVARVATLTPDGFDTPSLPQTVRVMLWLITAFGGVWGFSVLFNSPQKMACAAGLIGAVADTLRLELVDLGMPVEAAAFLGALTAGLLATLWRSMVRHGWIRPTLGFPRICLTVPSIVIMVPGLYMYRAVYALGELDTQGTITWAFQALLVMLMLPLGLAVARVVTDRGWRYDV